jgi:hypothetical protein
VYPGANPDLQLCRSGEIAWTEALVWPPAGSVIELGKPNRDALVLETRLQLAPGDNQALVLVSVRELEGEIVPRHAGDRTLDDVRQ